MSEEVGIGFGIDVLPGHCGVEARGVDDKVCFVAFLERKGKRYYSIPSGWFDIVPAEPIQLTWSAFEWHLPWRLRRAVHA